MPHVAAVSYTPYTLGNSNVSVTLVAGVGSTQSCLLYVLMGQTINW